MVSVILQLLVSLELYIVLWWIAGQLVVIIINDIRIIINWCDFINIALCRNPDHSDRPKFSEIVSYFSQSDSHLLHWTEDDLAVSPMVNKLSVSHHESIGLYKDLQTTYKPFSNDIEQFATSTNLRRGSSLSTIPSPRILKTDNQRDVPHFK